MIEDVYALSPLQEGMYYYWLSSPDSSVYFEQVYCRISGDLRLDLLEQSYKMLISRHAILRTFFTQNVEQKILQIVVKEVAPDFYFKDVRSDRSFSINQFKDDDRAKGFNLNKGSQMRLSVLRIADNSYEFVWSHHHILMDGWCVGVLINEFFQIYYALVQRKIPALNKVYSYSKYIDWITKLDSKESHSYWRNYLSGYDAISSLPVSNAIEMERAKNNERSFILDQPVRKAIDVLCKELKITENTFMLSVWGILLARYNNTTDVVFGSVVSGRQADIQGIEQIIGLFINTVPVRINWGEKFTVKDLVLKIQEDAIKAGKYHFTQLADIQSESELGRNLFNHIVQFQNYPVQDMVEEVVASLDDAKKLAIEAFSTSEQNNFDLTVIISPGTQMEVKFNYNRNIFEDQLIERLQDNLSALIEKIALYPDTIISEIDCLSVSEKKSLQDIGKTEVELPQQITVIDLFRKQAHKTPDAIAVVYDDVRLSYKELDVRSDQFANELRADHNVTPGDFVGVMLERSSDAIIAILGIMKAGAVYVPIDPAYPQTRKEFIIKDTGIKILIAKETAIELGNFNGTIIKADFGSSKEIKLEKISVRSEDLAYIIYTSGSTGDPKGVMIEHRSLANSILAQQAVINVKEGGRSMQFCSLSFDASIYEIFISLLAGSSLYIINEENKQNPSLLEDYIVTNRIDFLTVPAAYLKTLQVENLSTLEKLLVGGEAISPELFSNFSKHITCYNAYGPTEASICTTIFKAEKGEALKFKNVPIGKPISNTAVYITNDQLSLLPFGATGEICIGGAGLARGYFNQAELTTEKFVSNPFKEKERMYRTGDLGRWLPDGNIEFLGRKDEQVKIRGHRIELSEIERALNGYENLADVKVIAKKDERGDNELIAYFVSGLEIDAAGVKEYLKNSLPAYMIPGHFIRIDKFPLTTNGKIDRKKLPDPEKIIQQSGADLLIPHDDIELKLIGIWEQILGKTGISRTDHFFDLGGHSLKATTLASQIYKQLDVKVKLKDLFDFARLEEQAEHIRKSKKTGFITIDPAPVKEHYSLSSAQKRLFFLQELMPESASYNIQVVKFLGKSIERERIASSISGLIERHESLRTSFEKIDGVAFQKIHAQVPFKLEEAECLPEEFEAYKNSFSGPFDLSKAPLLRSAVVHIKNVGFVWLIEVHHIIFDGTSNHVVTKDFTDLYQGKSLPPLRLQYKDFSEYQNKLIESGGIETQKKFWLSQFENGIPVLNFPADRPRPDVFTSEGGVHCLTLDEQLTTQLNEFGKKHKGTLQMTILAAMNILLHKYTKQEDFIVGCSVAGRRHADMQNIVGMFVNSLAMRNQPQSSSSFLEFYNKVVSNSIAVYENQDVQFEDLVEMLKIERNPSGNPIFDVCIAVQNFEQAQTDSSTTAVEDDPYPDMNLEFEHSTSKFDMTWFVAELNKKIVINIEYYSAIYDQSTIERISSHFVRILKAVLLDPKLKISEIDILNDEEKQNILNTYSQGKTVAYPSSSSLPELFEKQCLLTPAAVAVKDENGAYTYDELHKRSNRLADFLTAKGLKKEEKVGLLMGRNKELIVSMLAILKAGGAFVPLDVDYPEDRLSYIIDDSAIRILLTEKNVIEYANRFFWGHEAIEHLVCVDSEAIHTEKGAVRNILMRKDLWDQVGESAVDAITGGGWMSSYTGSYLTEKEMTEYSENTYSKLEKNLNKEMKVLEIGCASGLTMFRVAPNVKKYVGVDLSSSILAKTQQVVNEKGFENIELVCLPAHEIDQLKHNEFDLVIINSVVQSFNGHNYLKQVLVNVLAKMKNTGVIFIGDIMDADKKESFIEDLAAFKLANNDKGYQTKMDWSNELFLSRNYLQHLTADTIGIVSIDFSEKIHTVANELTRFRYDAVLHVNKLSQAKFERKKHYHDLKEINNCNAISSGVSVKPNDLAYIIYTSGSTGRPKGVMIEHRSVINYISWANQTFVGDSHAGNFGLFTSISFDLTITSIFVPLMNGYAIHVYNSSLELSEIIPAAASGKNGEGVIKLTPSHITLMKTLGVSKFNIKKVIVGGEELRAEHTALLKMLQPEVEIYNEYGPTESTVGCICWKVEDDSESIWIGEPIMNTQVFIVDGNMELLPVGAIGEICIAGDGLARGYLNKPELTAEKFVVNPFKQGERMYKTGDLGRWRPDGNMEFLGRKDDQVKINGFRIELGEIENAIRTSTGQEVVVVISKNHQNDTVELVAYIASKEPINVLNIQMHLKNNLPAYMIPRHFIQIASIPLTTNGKVNKSKLPAVQERSTSQSEMHIKPRNETEEKLLLIWKEVLGVANAGITDNFFATGGNSFTAIKFQSLAQKRYGINFTIRDLFNSQTIEKMALAHLQSSIIISLSPETDVENDAIYFIPPVFGNSIIYKKLADRLGNKINSYGFQFKGLESGETFYNSIEQAASEFSEQLLKQYNGKDIVLLGYSFGAVIAFEMVKIFEAKNLNCQLILVDRNVKTNAFNYLKKIAEKGQVDWLVSWYKNMISSEHMDEGHMRSFLANNLSLINKYKQQGIIKSPIYAFESSGNKLKTNMMDWKKHTKNKVEVNFIEGSHWDALSDQNLDTFEKCIRLVCSESEAVMEK